ncbi:hypothetical protein [Novosphingobium mathurense]|uniref:hypothetical protein n=1 Tax=Novosphingobium mathurense TaxID=428990 RepID=UPI001115DCF6|nr:hypothetical protein [Novosphingobium mathurense]
MAGTLSALAACVASYLTLEQVILLKRERQTQFDVADYTNKQTAVRAVLLAAADYEDSALCYVNIRHLESQGRSQTRDKYQDCSSRVMDSIRRLESAIKSNVHALPPTYNYVMVKYLEEASTFNMCEFEKPLVGSSDFPKYLKDEFDNRCTRDTTTAFNDLIKLGIRLTEGAVEVTNPVSAVRR